MVVDSAGSYGGDAGWVAAVRVLSNNTVYVMSYSKPLVRRLAPGGVWETLVVTGQEPYGFDVDDSGTIYMSTGDSGTVERRKPDGSWDRVFTAIQNSDGYSEDARGISVAPTGGTFMVTGHDGVHRVCGAGFD